MLPQLVHTASYIWRGARGGTGEITGNDGFRRHENFPADEERRQPNQRTRSTLRVLEEDTKGGAASC
jgi:hypothetical protein